MDNVGVTGTPNGVYTWACACGEASGPILDRDQARTQYKEHRATCATVSGNSSAPEQQDAGAGEAPAQEKTMASKAKGTKKVAAKKPAAKKGAVRKVDRTRKVSPEEVHQVMELVKAGKSSIMAEADRLGVYHATLRATCRSIVGEAKYDSIMKGPAKKARLAARAAAVESKKAKVSTKKKAAKKAPKAKKAATPPTTEASTEGEQTA